MRKLSAVLAALMLTATAAVSSPFGHARELVMRKLSLQRKPSPLATAPRRRSVTPPFNSACPQKVLLQPVSASVLATGGDSLYFSDSAAGIVRVAKGGGLPTVITWRTISGTRRASSRPSMPPALWPMMLTCCPLR